MKLDFDIIFTASITILVLIFGIGLVYIQRLKTINVDDILTNSEPIKKEDEKKSSYTTGSLSLFEDPNAEVTQSEYKISMTWASESPIAIQPKTMNAEMTFVRDVAFNRNSNALLDASSVLVHASNFYSRRPKTFSQRALNLAVKRALNLAVNSYNYKTDHWNNNKSVFLTQVSDYKTILEKKLLQIEQGEYPDKSKEKENILAELSAINQLISRLTGFPMISANG